jgi:hypothetical protein
LLRQISHIVWFYRRYVVLFFYISLGRFKNFNLRLNRGKEVYGRNDYSEG